MADSTKKKPNFLIRFYRFAKMHGLQCAIYISLNRLANFRIWRRWFQLSIVNIYSAPVSILKSSKQLPGLFKVRPAETSDLAALNDYCGNTERTKNRMDRGDICMINFCNDKIGAMTWFSLGPNVYDEDWQTVQCRVRFPERVAWMFDGKGTRLGAWGGMMRLVPNHLEELGIDDIYTMVDYDNRKSIDPMLSLGLTEAGSFLFLKFFGLKLTRCKTIGHKWSRLPTRIGRLEITSKSETHDEMPA